MTITHALLLTCIAGSTGGLADALSHLVDDGKDSNGHFVAPNGVNLKVFCAVRSFVGLGGALAVLLVYIWSGRFKEGGDVTEQLFLVCLGFVAGFAGRTLLPMVSARLEGMIAKAVEQQVQQKTGGLEAKIDNAVQYGETTSAANLALAHLTNSQTPATTIEEDIKDLEALRHGPALRNRRLAIVLGRLYGRSKNYDAALSVLGAFLEEKAQVGEQDDKDSADVLYNVACYRALKSASAPADQAGPLKDSALETLERSVKLSLENAKLAQTDPDLAPLRDDQQRKERFNQIISSQRST